MSVSKINRPSLLTWCCCLGAAGILLVSQSTHAEETLRWQFRAGEKSNVVCDQSMEQITTVDGESKKTVGKTRAYLTTETKNVYSSMADVRVSFDRLWLEMQVEDGGPVTYDTASTEEAISFDRFFAQQVQPMIGAAFLQRVNLQGEVVEAVMEPGSLEKLRAAKGGVFSETALRKVISQSAASFPAGPLSEGMSWKRTETTETPFGKLVTLQTYTYRGAVNNGGSVVHKVEMVGKMSRPDAPGAPFLAIREQDIRGTLYFDNENGKLLGSEVSQDVTLQHRDGDKDVRTQLKSHMRLTVSPMVPEAETARQPGDQPPR